MKLKKTIVHFQSMGEAVDIQNAFFALGNSFHQGGDVYDTEHIPGYVRVDHNGNLAYGPEHLAEQFPDYKVMTLKDLKKLSQKDVSVSDKPIVSDGGSSDYYKLTITNKAGETINCETGDILRALVGNDYDLSNIVKACRRMYEASQGRGKSGISIAYDANKVKYFADEFKHWNKEKQNA